MTTRIVVQSDEPSPAAKALASEVVARSDRMAENPDILWRASTRIRDEAFDFLADALVGLRLDGATDEECDGVCRLVFSIIQTVEDATRKELERMESYRIDEGAGE